MKTSRLAMIVASLITTWTAQADAEDRIRFRCSDDLRDTSQAIGRNAWARRCGVIDEESEHFYNAHGNYAVFANLLAPVTEHEPCVAGAAYLGLCNVAGCYTPTQRVFFDGQYETIERAAQSDVKKISALPNSWKPGDDLKWQGEEIENFVVGEEYGDILTIHTDGGHRLEVTKNHPMVTASGDVVPASSLIAGETEVLTSEGARIVTHITTRPYRGMVWNVQPRTNRTLGNIHLAENFVTGSVRYQNEWLDAQERLHLRNTADTTSF